MMENRRGGVYMNGIPSSPPHKGPESNMVCSVRGLFCRQVQDRKELRYLYIDKQVFFCYNWNIIRDNDAVFLRDRDEAVICRISFEKCRSFHGKDLRAVGASVGSPHTELPKAYRTSLSGHKRSDETDRERKPCLFVFSFRAPGCHQRTAPLVA